MYKLNKDRRTGEFCSVNKTNEDGSISSIPFAPDNTDYANFKKAINEETAELQDADGNTMTAAEAKEFVATLP